MHLYFLNRSCSRSLLSIESKESMSKFFNPSARHVCGVVDRMEEKGCLFSSLVFSSSCLTTSTARTSQTAAVSSDIVHPPPPTSVSNNSLSNSCSRQLNSLKRFFSTLYLFASEI